MTLGAIYTDPKPFRHYMRIRRLAPGTWTADNKPTPPQGWRWLNLGEWTQDDDLCCDPRAWPVVIDSGSSMMNRQVPPRATEAVRRSAQPEETSADAET